MKENSITMTVKETAEYLGVSKELLYRLIRDGQFSPAVKFGKTLFVRKTELEKWIEEQTEVEAKRVKGEKNR